MTKETFQERRVPSYVLMEIPQGFEEFTENFDRKTQCLALNNAVNGLKQSGNEFYKNISKVMQEIGFNRSNSDPCVFYKRKRGKLIVVGVHVDDGKFVGETEKSLICLMQE